MKAPPSIFGQPRRACPLEQSRVYPIAHPRAIDNAAPLPDFQTRRRFCLMEGLKNDTAPRIVIARPRRGRAISGRHCRFVPVAVKMAETKSQPVAAVTAQPLAALPPYGCGVPFTGGERHAGWQHLPHEACGMRPPSLSLRGGRRPTRQSREGSCSFAITYLLSTWVLRNSHVASLLGMTSLNVSRR